MTFTHNLKVSVWVCYY